MHREFRVSTTLRNPTFRPVIALALCAGGIIACSDTTTAPEPVTLPDTATVRITDPTGDVFDTLAGAWDVTSMSVTTDSATCSPQRSSAR
jgi:hypothetical protein